MTMRLQVVEGLDTNEVYVSAMKTLLSEGERVGSRVAPTIEVHPMTMVIRDPTSRLVTSYGRPVNVAFALAEVIWILAGRSDVEFLLPYNSKIGDYSDNGYTFNAAYGHRARHAHGHDQIRDILELLTADPESRQATLVLTHPGKDRAYDPRYSGDAVEYVKHSTKDRACNLLAHMMIRNDTLDWMQVIRSNDSMWGTPYNFMQFMHLQEFFAASLGLAVGSYMHVADSFHLYDYHEEEAQGVSSFNLYDAMLQARHAPITKLGTTEPALHFMVAAITNMQIITNASKLYTYQGPQVEQVGPYWVQVIEIIRAYHLYKMGEHVAAASVLVRMDDQVLAMAQARHFWYWNWHRQVQTLFPMDIIKERTTEPVVDWIRASHK